MPEKPVNALLEAALYAAGKAARIAGIAVGAGIARLRRRAGAEPGERFSILNAEFLQGAFLFLAMAIAGIGADSSYPGWSLLLPPMIAMILLIAGLFDPRAEFSGLGLLAVAGLGLGWLVAPLWARALGPLPYPAFCEAIGTFAAVAAAAALWSVAMQLPVAAHIAWIAALSILFLVRLPLDSGSPLFRPDTLPILLSALWGVVALGGALQSQPAAVARRRVLPWHVLAVAFGAFLGFLCVRHSIAADLAMEPEARDSLARGRGELAALWGRSMLFGWGRFSLGRVGDAFAEPLAAEMPRWLGWIGTLAVSGIFSAAGAAALSLAIASVARRRAARGVPSGAAPQLSLLAAQFLLGLWAAGGPNSSIPALLAAGWMGLGVATMPREEPGPAEEEDDGPGVFTLAGRYTCSMLAMGAIALATICAAAPIHSARFVARHQNPKAIQDPRLNRKIYRARAIFPWNPDIYALEAARLRQQLDEAQGWNETLYLRVVEAYERAIAADPLDPLISLKLVRVQMLAKRMDDAKATALRAMKLNPRSEELPETLFAYATANGQPDLAMEMILRGIEINPASPAWRWRLYQARLANARGERSDAALAAALTSDPGNPMFFRAALGRASRNE